MSTENMLYKSSSAAKITDLDTKRRIVSGYLATWDIDSDMEAFVPGAFTNSLELRGVKSKGRKIVFLYHHATDKPVGKFLELAEDEIGLRFVSQLSRSQLGVDTFYDYEDGVIEEHSVGFFELNGKSYYDDGVKYMRDVHLFEGSCLALGANSNARVVDIATKALQTGNGSDSRLQRLEAIAKQIDFSENGKLAVSKIVSENTGVEESVIPILKNANISHSRNFNILIELLNSKK